MQFFNTGQEVISADLNSLQSRMERSLFGIFFYEMLGRKVDAFFQDGFKPVWGSATEVTINAGLGFQLTDEADTKEPLIKPVYLPEAIDVVIGAAHATLNRIDIICAKAERVDDEIEARRYKEEFVDTIFSQDFTISKKWLADVIVVAGVAHATPVAPAIPAGYLKIAQVVVTAVTGVVNQAAITDSRELLPIASGISNTGMAGYDAIVGNVGFDQGANYASLADALADSQDGWKILVVRSETVNATNVVLNDNIEIVFKRGVTLTKGAATIGLQLDGNDCKIVGARLKDFITGGDKGIKISAGALRTILDTPRFNNCATNIEDLGNATFINVEYTE